MSRFISLIVLSLLTAASAVAQSTSPRTPGRVGGSPNNPPALRPKAAPKNAFALALAPTMLDPDEKKEFDDAKQYIPDLTVYDFFQIEYLTTKLRENHKELTPAELAEKISVKGNHVVATLQQIGLSKSDAKKMYAESKRQADKRVEVKQLRP